MKKLTGLLFVLMALLIAIPASAEPIAIEPGYSVEVFVAGLGISNDLIFDASGNLFVSETEEQSVLKIEVDQNGTAGNISVYATGIPDAEGVALDESDILFVSDGDAVYKIVEGMEVRFVEGFNDPEGITFDHSGDLFVADDVEEGLRISKIDVLENGSAGDVSTFAIIPTGGSAAGIEFDAKGDLYVADNEDQVWRIVVQDGTVADISPFVGDLISPFGLAFDTTGNLFVGSAHSGDIWKVDTGGNASQFASEIAGATGLAFDARGNLFATEESGGRIFKFVREFETVNIDIKPDSDNNSINCYNEYGVLPVSILTTDVFDATTVDHTTVTFEGASEYHVNRQAGEAIRHVEDVDLDGDMDLVFHFRLGDTALNCDSTEGNLIGETYDGMPIEGSDSIRMINPEGS